MEIFQHQRSEVQIIPFVCVLDLIKEKEARNDPLKRIMKKSFVRQKDTNQGLLDLKR